MKLNPTTLFVGTTTLFLVLGILNANKSTAIQLHDTYIVVSYLYLATALSILTGIASLSYFCMENVKRPIKQRTGFWHFGFFIIGLLLLMFSLSYYGDNNSDSSSVYGPTVIIVIGVGLLLTSFVVFTYGLAKALLSRKQS